MCDAGSRIARWSARRSPLGGDVWPDWSLHVGTVVLRAVDRDPVLCSRHDARFRLLSAQEKTLASCGSQDLSAGWGEGLGAGGTPPGASPFNAGPAHAVPWLGKAQRP